MKIKSFITLFLRSFSQLIVIGVLLISAHKSYAQCDTLLGNNVGMRLRFWDSDFSNPADTIDLSENLKSARNFEVVGTLVADNCPREQIASLATTLREATLKITDAQKAKLAKQQTGPRARIGVIIRFNNTISLSHLFTIINQFQSAFIDVDLINNEILVTIPI